MKDFYNFPSTILKYEEALNLKEIDLSQFNNSYRDACNFYHTYVKKLYLDNTLLIKQLSSNSIHIKTLARQKADLSAQVKKLQALLEAKNSSHQQTSQHTEEKKRRKRRSANEIERLYRCRAENCGKSYGSQGTLSQHLKLKHPELYVPPFGGQQIDQQQNDKEEGNSNKSERQIAEEQENESNASPSNQDQE